MGKRGIRLCKPNHGRDGRFYLYAPIMQTNSTDKNGFGIGVAVANQIEERTLMHGLRDRLSRTLPGSKRHPEYRSHGTC